MATPHEHFPDDDLVDIVVADSFSLDICEHGYGRLAFWHEGEKRPFAVAFFAPDAAFDMARMIGDAIKTIGNA